MTAADFATASVKDGRNNGQRTEGKIIVNSKILYPPKLLSKSEDDSDQT